MKTNNLYKLDVAITLIVLLLISGCAPSAKPLDVTKLQSIDTVTIAQSECPPLLKKTIGSQTAAATGVLFGAIGGGFGGALSYSIMESNGKEVQEACGLPNFANLLIEKFSTRMPNEVENWPNTVVESSPVDPNNLPVDSTILFVKVNSIILDNGKGLTVSTTAQLTDRDKNVLWQKHYNYISSENERTPATEPPK
jgi:hypothetical protein